MKSKPNIISTMLAVASCKATRGFLRLTGRGGTAIPGKVAMKFAGNILSAVSDGMHIVLVTGTNGKTTTCNMIANLISSSGRDCLLNKSGANLLHGIASDLISESDFLGRPKHEYAVLECDEAALKQVMAYISPDAVVVTNLFSDQVDRYGGVENTLAEIRKAVELSPSSSLVLNADDPLTSSLALCEHSRLIGFGMASSVGVQGDIDLKDAGKCPVCGADYEYSYNVYAHLGGFKCSSCGYGRKDPEISVKSFKKEGTEGSSVILDISGKEYEGFISLPAVYNVYNAAAAIGAGLALGIDAGHAVSSLSEIRSSFGRMESFDLDGTKMQMILVKNPAGCNQAFSYVTGFGSDYSAVLCLNDRTGDGHDISWIEDTDYEKLCSDPHLKKLYVAGDRKQELYDRLLRAGADESMMELVTDYPSLVDTLASEERPVFLLPNYTSMMELRSALSRRTGNKDFWQ